MGLSWTLPAWTGLVHVASLFIWISAMIYPLIGLSLQPSAYVESLKRIQPWVLGAMTVAVITGFLRILEMGGFKVLPTPFHIKVTLGLLMVVATLLQFFYFLPKAQSALAGGIAGRQVLNGFTLCGTSVVVLTLAILLILSGLGLL